MIKQTAQVGLQIHKTYVGIDVGELAKMASATGVAEEVRGRSSGKPHSTWWGRERESESLMAVRVGRPR